MLFCGAEAVNKPDASIVPQEAVHVEEILALNFCVNPCAVVALPGLIDKGEVIVAAVDAV
jgi:hypothetical protein